MRHESRDRSLRYPVCVACSSSVCDACVRVIAEPLELRAEGGSAGGATAMVRADERAPVHAVERKLGSWCEPRSRRWSSQAAEGV